MDETHIALLAILAFLVVQQQTHEDARPRWDRRGGERMIEILQHPRQAYETLGCSISTFLALVNWIRVNAEDCVREYRDMSLDEKVAIFLYICRHGVGQRNCENFFARSSSTVSR